jgi:putative addiction module component (TIGR02574 family)
MSTYPEILEAALTLPPSQRGELAELLWESMADAANHGDAALEISDTWRAEIARRSAEIDAGTAKCVTWEEMRNRARRLAGHDG